MTINHHLSDALLMAHAAGQLSEAFNLVVATHLSLCDDCRARALACDALGGEMIDAADPCALAADSFETTMARIAAADRAPDARPLRVRQGLLPTPLQDYVGGDLAAVKWRSVGMGVRQAILTANRRSSARLLYIPAGQAMPDHGHNGMELTLVLQGAFLDGADRFGPGDVEMATEETNHCPVADVGADCICLAATDAPLRFRQLLPRMAQPFFRI